MSLDILSPKGRESLADEQRLLKSFASHYGYSIIQTPKDSAADVDGLVCANNGILAVFESKCRDCDLEQMRQWNFKWLVTYDKLIRGAAIAKSLQVPFYGFLFLKKEPIGVSIRIADKDGNFIPDIRISRTETQRTINGGEVIRTNAYIDLTHANTFPIL
jgi:hypothetical protein